VPAEADVHLKMRVRQIRAVLEAHGVRVEQVDVGGGEDPRGALLNL
jgi:hypothetical protein